MPTTWSNIFTCLANSALPIIYIPCFARLTCYRMKMIQGEPQKNINSIGSFQKPNNVSLIRTYQRDNNDFGFFALKIIHLSSKIDCEETFTVAIRTACVRGLRTIGATSVVDSNIELRAAISSLSSSDNWTVRIFTRES